MVETCVCGHMKWSHDRVEGTTTDNGYQKCRFCTCIQYKNRVNAWESESEEKRE